MTLTKSDSSKFDYLVEEIAYAAVMEGFADDDFQLGEGENMALVTYDPALPFDNARLTDADRAFLAQHQAALVSNDSQGFVYVAWYTSADDARRDFAYYRTVGEWSEGGE